MNARVAAVLAALFAQVSCDSLDRRPAFRRSSDASPRNGGRLRIATKDQIRTLDPAISYDEVSTYAVHALFDTLVDYSPAVRGDETSGLTIEPHLAAAWTVSSDGREYRFALRAGVAYADGTPIVAGDFVYSLERVLRTADSPFGAFLIDVDGAQAVLDHNRDHCTGITAPSDRELVIHLHRPNAAFLHVLTMSFTTPQRADHVAAAGEQLRRQPLGQGPFTLERWDEGRRLVLRRNPHYWDAAHIYLDAIELVENVPRDIEFLMFERGELDSAERPAAPDYLWLLSRPDWSPYIQQRAGMNAYGSRMNVRREPFHDRRVRQALNYALNKQHSVKLLSGTAVASHGILPPGMFGRDDQLAPYPHDPARARTLLAQAGYPNGFDIDYVVMNDDEAERLATSLQSDFAEVGVRVHIQPLSFATYGTAIGSVDGPAFSKATWTADYPDPTNFLDANFHSRMIANENSTNNSFYANPTLDALLDAARSESDTAARAAMYRQAERILYDDAPWIWDYHQLMTEVVAPYVHNYALHPMWLRDYRAAWLDGNSELRPVSE